MPSRVITKALAGLEDLLFGRGSVNQARAGGTYAISKISLPLIITDVAELANVDHTKFPFVGVIDDTQHLCFYEYVNGTGYVAAELTNVTAKSRGSFSLTSSALTSIITEDVTTKLLGVTTPSTDNVNFNHTSGRLIYTGTKEDLFLVTATVQVASANQDELNFYFAVDSDPVLHSKHVLPAIGSAVPRCATWSAVIKLQPNQFVEVYVANKLYLTDVTAVGYNLAVVA